MKNTIYLFAFLFNVQNANVQCNDSFNICHAKPLPFSLTNQQNIAQLGNALDSIRNKIPQIQTLGLEFRVWGFFY